MHISVYKQANRYNHQEDRARKLLLNKREIIKLFSQTREKGYSVIPLSLYIKEGLAKLEIGLAKGKKTYDKREDLKQKDQQRRLEKVMREY